MQRYTLNKYDFVRFLLEERKDTRLEDTIFWVSTFPLPVIIVHNVFEHRGNLIRTFINHLQAVLIYANALKAESDEWNSIIEMQPTPANKVNEEYFLEIFEKGLHDSAVEEVVRAISSMLMVDSYNPTATDLFNAICHEGRKYKRLYLPKSLKEIIQKHNSQLLKSIATGNIDMFGQPVADEFGIYRMGFSDKLCTIFNMLLDFVITHNDGNSTTGLANASDIKIVQKKVAITDNPFFEYGSISDDSAWEPAYRKASTYLVLNNKHSFSDLLHRTDTKAEEVVADLLLAISECENEAVSDREKRFYETMRQDVSRKLRQKIRNKL